MARRISWLNKLPDIRKAVGGSSSSHFDRGDISNLFEVQKSAAGKLMGLMPRSGMLGSSHLVEKIELLNFLKGVHGAKDAPAHLEKLKRDGPKVYRRRKIQLSKREDGLHQPANPLRPGSIVWSRGKIEILGSESAEAAIETMFWAALTVLADREAFERDYCVEKPAGLARLADALDSSVERERRREYMAWCERAYGPPLFARAPKVDGSSDGTSISPSM